MIECESAEEKVEGMDKPSDSEDQVKNTGNVGCENPASEEERLATFVDPPPPHISDQLDTGRKSMLSWKSPFSVPVSLGCSNTSTDRTDFQCSSTSSTEDVDCLVCFNRYSCSRLPKLLACQHTFCAVCLKLILRNEDNTWRIACPVCRKVTTVFGGLICSLPNREDIGHLANHAPNTETFFSPDTHSETLVIHSTFSTSRDEELGYRVAAKRLMFLLLLLVILVVFTLPFVYGGLLTWVLYFAVALGLIGVGVLFCNPNWRCSCSNIPTPFWCKCTRRIASAA
ncbi:E3 ubiquitin-protein ligase RNF186-like [Eublepharis macularius]|uniref:E3 ubiquitin-protein ligase RNF186-like n=1 Tax=Eublepharis macularius TaxID=481883 RepID=A0AA97KIU7_EUBMA|nr:E3 ubiquitin-protein ligase RNF186-like [Eublepharis macularius]